MAASYVKEANKAEVALLKNGDEEGPEKKAEKKNKDGNSRFNLKEKYENTFTAVKENKIFSGCVMIDIILIITILSVTCGWLNFAQTEIVAYDPDEYHYCMKCEYVENEDKFFPDGQKDGMCCAGENGKYLEHVLSKYVNRTLNEEFREKPLFQLCLNSTSAEHPKGYIQIMKISSHESSLPHLNLIKWGSQPKDNRDIMVNIKYDEGEGEFQVDRPGYYHVYCNLVFDYKMDNVSFPAVIRHLILKYRKDYNVGEKLLEGYSTQCETLAPTSFSSFVFGNFYFEKTDKIKVFLSDPTYLSAGKSYVGMYLI